MIIGHGVDLVEIARIEQMLDRHADRFLDRVYTELERAYALESPRKTAERLAARFAAKEAALKALGTGWRSGIAWTDIGVISSPTGQPSLEVIGRAAEIAREMQVGGWMISLSHSRSHAIASVIALGG